MMGSGVIFEVPRRRALFLSVWILFGGVIVGVITLSFRIEGELPPKFGLLALVLVWLFWLPVSYGLDRAVDHWTRKNADLEAKLARAQLNVLTAQLTPHFLFNSLNVISALMYEDVEKADATMTHSRSFKESSPDARPVRRLPDRVVAG